MKTTPFFEKKYIPHLWFCSESNFQNNEWVKNFPDRTHWSVLAVTNWYQKLINWLRYRLFKFCQKSGFFPKMGVMATLFENFYQQCGSAGWVPILWGRPFFPTPFSFSANRKKLNFAKIKNDKSVFSDISWRLTSFIFFLCAAFQNRLIALMKLFSLGRTVLAVSSKFAVRIAL